IRVINEFGCEAKSNDLYIQPGPPVGSIPGGCHTRCRPDTLCLPPNLPNIASWQWYFDGNPIAGATGPDLVATQSGTYWAVLTDGFGCIGQSDPLSLHLFDAYGNVTGKVWADVNNNGVIDPADTLVSGIPVDLYQNGSPVAYGQSNVNGSYAFTNILSANYTVQIDAFSLPANWQVVTGQGPANMSGCQTLATADLLLKFVCQPLSSTLQLQACPGSFAMYQSTAIPTGSSQSFAFTNNGCDSTVTVTVQALQTSASTLTLKTCPGHMVAYGGMQLTAGTVQDFVFSNALGCDSTVTVTVQALQTSASNLTLKACSGSTVAYGGMQLTPGTVQDFMFQNIQGCDSTVTVTVQALQNSISALTLKTCPGTTVAYGGLQLTAGTVQDVVIQNYQGCDSTVTVTVQELPVSASSLTLQGCPGSTVGYNGLQLVPGTVQGVLLQNYLGCDSTVTVTVQALQNSASLLEVSVCRGEAFIYANTAIPVGQTQDFHLMNAEGCDSIVTVVVTAYPSATFALLADSSCVNQSTGSITVNSVTGGLAPYQFSLDGGTGQTDSLFQNLGIGQHAVEVEDANGCTVTQSAQIDEWPRLILVLPNGILPCDSSGVRLT
ncbi:MAG: SdrD B-like domain-containing protein, partial [Saprospiraceae bacterium]